MDELDEQLQQLHLINGRVAANSHLQGVLPETVNVTRLVQSIEGQRKGSPGKFTPTPPPLTTANNFVTTYDDNKQQQQQQHIQKKIGPLVPPKPNKKSTIQSDNYEKYNAHNWPSPALMLRKNQYSGAGIADQQISSMVTLDNPLVLEQQLEALEHHKKQLDRRNRLSQQKGGTNDGGRMLSSPSPLAAIPKLSSTSLLSASLEAEVKHHKNEKMRHTSDNTYANMPATATRQPPPSDLNVYSNLMSSVNKALECTPENSNLSYLAETAQCRGNTIYSNLLYDKENGAGNNEDGNSCSDTKEFFNVSNEDELLPPPPSPVSSSYSELRRASEMFKVRQGANNTITTAEAVPGGQEINKHRVITQQQQQQQQQQIVLGEKYPFYGEASAYNANEYKNYNLAAGQQSNALNAADYYGYGGFSQSSSCYESLYEPINPRPPSQLSSNPSHNFVMYGGSGGNKSGSSSAEFGGGDGVGILSKSISSNLTSLGGSSGSSDSNPPNYGNNNNNNQGGPNLDYTTKGNDVEALTDYLVQSMDGNNSGGGGGVGPDLESYGICYKCQQRVMGENSGCTAMDQIYHIGCFTCVQCQINLQGKAFYALEGKPYCEYDYLQTLEKCSVCMKPILERILRATGKPYHPQCFTCVVCMKSLDGIPFTVDATNQNYCIEDFHKKFAPRCCVCKHPIMPEPGEEETVRVVALDRSFHFECYKCEDCGLLLSSEAEGRGCYPLDDHVLCKSCNAKRVQMLTSRMITEL